MKWGEKREYKRVRKAIADIVSQPLSKTSNADMKALRLNMQDMRGQKTRARPAKGASRKLV